MIEVDALMAEEIEPERKEKKPFEFRERLWHELPELQD